MKTKITSIIMAIVILVSGSQMVFATENEQNTDPLALWNSMVVYDGSFEEIEFNPTSREYSVFSRNENRTITIPVVGMSSFVSFDMERYNLTADTYEDFIANDVIYESSDTNIVVAYDGRILARGVGEAVVTIKVGDQEERINVRVGNKVSQELVEQVMEITSGNTRSAESDERNAIVQKGADIVSCIWRPTQDLVGWKSGHTYKANEYQFGIPYTQKSGGMCDEVEFLSAMNNSDFYTPYYHPEKHFYMPTYGNDCSAFVAICWGLPYNEGRYNSTRFYNEYTSIGGYANLQRGDAVVKIGHIFLVIQNWEVPPSGSDIKTSYVTCYEQTPYNAQLTFWTYTQLSNDGYKAISNF